MPIKWMVLVAGLLAAGITFAPIKLAQADDWPSRPLTMVVPFAAGGPTDVVGRMVAERLSDVLGQHIVVENVGGAGGMIGAQRVALANPDGYQVLLGTVGTQAYNQTLYKKPLYNAVDDFTPVVLIAEQPLVLVVPKDFPADSLKSFTIYVKDNSAKLSFGSGGSGSATHLGCVLLNTAIGVDVQHVPYRGSAPAMQDLIAARINYLCDAVSTALPHIKSGAVKPIAVLARHRSAVLPDVPTAEEQGLAGFEANNWIGLFFPRNTPEKIVHRLHDATTQAMNAPALRTRTEAIGTDLVSADRTDSDYLKRFVSSEITKWALPIKASGVSVDADNARSSERLVQREDRPADVPPPLSAAPRPVSSAPGFADSAPVPGAASVFPPTPLAQPAPAARVETVNNPPAATVSPIPSADQAGAPAAPTTTPASPTQPGPKKIRTVSIRTDQPNGSEPAESQPQSVPVRPTTQQEAAKPSDANGPLSIQPSSNDAERASAGSARTAPPARSAPVGKPGATKIASTSPAASGGGYAVQVLSQHNEKEVQSSFRALQAKFPKLHGGRELMVRRAGLGAKGVYYRATVGPFVSAEQANELCSNLKAAGGSCIVQKK
jgi:tripartite-type tricarboxylate transporter receptor subunit TctC